MNTKFVFKSLFLTALLVFLFTSCDKDFNDVGGDVLDGNHFDFDKYTESTVVAYNQATGVVQSNYVTGNTATVTVNPFGLLNNPAFGTTRANFVTQAQLSVLSPTFGEKVVVDSVILSIPYFSTKESTSTTGEGTYTLDSIHGANPIKLSVFESGYYINSLDPDEEANFETQLKFYNDDARFENYRKGIAPDGTPVFNGLPLNDSTDPKQNDAFVFSDKEIVLTEAGEEEGDEETVTRLAPAMRLELNKNYFKTRIIDAPADKLNNQERFKEYFKGLYFKAEQSASDPQGKGSLAMLDFTKGTITINYTEEQKVTVDGVETTKEVKKSIILNLVGNRISLTNESAINTDYQAALTATGPDTATGDEKLYLKGGQGSIAIIDLFGATDLIGDPVTGGPNLVPDELDNLRAKGWLINEANLVFNMDTDKMNDSYAAQRIYLYDMTNKRPLYDYSADGSTNPAEPKKSRSIFGGILEKATKDGVVSKKYKIRITRYINNIINKDSTNVRLGLVVTEGIDEIRNNSLKTAVILENNFKLDRIPTASVLNPLGTILWGNTATVPEDKKLKLEIFYTKPN